VSIDKSYQSVYVTTSWQYLPDRLALSTRSHAAYARQETWARLEQQKHIGSTFEPFMLYMRQPELHDHITSSRAASITTRLFANKIVSRIAGQLSFGLQGERP